MVITTVAGGIENSQFHRAGGAQTSGNLLKTL